MVGKIKKWAHKMCDHKMYVDEKNPKKFFKFPCHAGIQEIRILRNEGDVTKALKGHGKGNTLSCMNAQCVRSNGGYFPHEVHMAIVTQSRVIIIDELDGGGMPKHGVVYSHNDGKGVAVHDKKGPKAILESGQAAKVLVLSPIPKRKSQKDGLWRAAKRDGSRPGASVSRKTVIPHGAKRRAVQAGFIPAHAA